MDGRIFEALSLLMGVAADLLSAEKGNVPNSAADTEVYETGGTFDYSGAAATAAAERIDGERRGSISPLPRTETIEKDGEGFDIERYNLLREGNAVKSAGTRIREKREARAAVRRVRREDEARPRRSRESAEDVFSAREAAIPKAEETSLYGRTAAADPVFASDAGGREYAVSWEERSLPSEGETMSAPEELSRFFERDARRY